MIQPLRRGRESGSSGRMGGEDAREDKGRADVPEGRRRKGGRAQPPAEQRRLPSRHWPIDRRDRSGGYKYLIEKRGLSSKILIFIHIPGAASRTRNKKRVHGKGRGRGRTHTADASRLDRPSGKAFSKSLAPGGRKVDPGWRTLFHESIGGCRGRKENATTEAKKLFRARLAETGCV